MLAPRGLVCTPSVRPSLACMRPQREIELRQTGAAMTEDEETKVVQKLVKQRQDSIESYQAGGRDDLVAAEEVEMQLLLTYLPAMLSRDEVSAVVDAVVTELGASSVKQMGAVMKEVGARVGAKADGKMVSEIVKKRLTA
ncbi:hypothetical protein FOA52_011181 [Chlamydomonas sp. UWO 241]|nr:hypothetical protein FOA52_011181 [Chlamydomonas sp. UWO 241]